MAAVAHASPADIRRLSLVRTSPVLRPARTSLPTTVYRRRRAMALLILVSVGAAVVLVVNGLLGALGGGDPLSASQRPGTAAQRPGTAAQGPRDVAGLYVVQPGDTFWAIATRLHPGEDPRPLVTRMVAAHGSPVLVAGERLALPAA